jgi:hypothetical protein
MFRKTNYFLRKINCSLNKQKEHKHKIKNNCRLLIYSCFYLNSKKIIIIKANLEEKRRIMNEKEN